jgi:hypothetical protein
MPSTPKGNTNVIVYVKSDLTQQQYEQAKNMVLGDIIKQLNIPVGFIQPIDNYCVVINSTDNFVAASLKMNLRDWCKVETFQDVHPRLNPHVGPLARGSY